MEKLVQDRGHNADTFVFYVECLYRERTAENLDLRCMAYGNLLSILEGFQLLGYITDSECESLIEQLRALYSTQLETGKGKKRAGRMI